MKAVSLVKTALAAIAGIGISTGASAAIINSEFMSGVNTIQDSDAEYVLDAQGQVKTTGDFAVGDTIVANLIFDTVNGTQIPVAVGSLTYQMMAYSELEIGAINDNGNGTWTLVFTPSGNLGAGVFAEIYEGDPSNYSQALAPAAGTAAIMAETLIAEFGIGEADDFWTATVASLDLATIAASLPSAQAAIGTFGLSLLSNPGALPIGINAILGADGNLHDLVGTASAYSLESGVNAGYLVSSNLEARFVAVPEPGSLALASLGMLAAGFALRRGASKS